MQRDQLRVISNWLKRLSELTRPNAGSKGATLATIKSYAELLADGYPASVFDQRSARDIALEAEFFPTYKELTERLDGWIAADKLRRQERIATPEGEAARARIEQLRDGDAWKAEQAAHAADAKADWSDPDRVRAAVRKLDATENEIGDYIGAHPHRMLLGGILAGLVAKHCPANLGYLPPEFINRLPDFSPRVVRTPDD